MVVTRANLTTHVPSLSRLVATFVLACSYTQTVEMLRTRLEIEALLKKATGNLQKTQEIHRELQSLMNYIQNVLDASSSAKRKSPKPSRS